MILPTRTVEKPWGRDTLPAPFVALPGQRIGEIWFEPPPQLPGLLVKYIFTSEKLSVQVHPTDAQTLASGLGRQGKEECWLVLDAEPGAELGIGFSIKLTPGAVRTAAENGSIEDMLVWHEVQRGDFFYIPANTVHAIGAGVTLIEVQQNSDITYRLYDYGRPRELHLKEGVQVANPAPYDSALHRRLPDSGHAQLVDGPQFRLEWVQGQPDAATTARFGGALLVIPLSGEMCVAGDPVAPGQCALAMRWSDIDFAAAGQCLLASATADQEAAAITG
jgi:mannose-6-phosphate isomerase